MKYQIVCMDKKGFIEEYKDFNDKEIDKMLRYLNTILVSPIIAKIEIGRWNHRGERQ